MNRKLRVVALSTAMCFGCSTPWQANATGIPTLDIADIAQAVANAAEQATQAAEQLSALERDIAQAKSQFEEHKRLLTGNSGYGSRYYNTNSEMYTYLPTSTTQGSWEQIYTNMDNSTLNGYRDKYGLRSDNSTQQAVFDKQLTNLRTAEGAYKANNLRLENLKQLQALADSATTPQEKEDIQARLQIEQGNIANEANRLATAKDLMERQDKMMAQKQNQEFDKFLSGE